MFDIIAIGGATQDIFIESDLGKILTMRDSRSDDSYLCFEYGAKIDIDKLASDVGGGAINSIVNFADLGFKTSVIAKLGNDLNAQAVLERLNKKNVDKSLLLKTDEYKTGFSVILTSFEGDRTVLTHRGANSQITLNEIRWEKIKEAKWIYIASLSGNSNQVLDKLAEFAEENGISMAFNPGSAQIKRGLDDLKKVLSTVEILVLNEVEASLITGISENFEAVNSNIYQMLYKLKSYGPKVIVITQGSKGVQAFDGEIFYAAPVFPAEVVSTLGAGDAFSSTFVACMIKHNWNAEKSIILASINAASIIQSFGAQTGLKNFDELEEIANQSKDFKITKKNKDSIQNHLEG